MLRTNFLRATRQQTRLFHSTPYVAKSVTDNIKDAAQKINKTVSDAAVDGINKGANAADSLKQATGMSVDEASKEARKGAEELRGQAQGAASQMSGKASEVEGKAKGAASELAGKGKGAAEEAQKKM